MKENCYYQVILESVDGLTERKDHRASKEDPKHQVSYVLCRRGTNNQTSHIGQHKQHRGERLAPRKSGCGTHIECGEEEKETRRKEKEN